MTFCDKCGASFTRKYNLIRHQTSRCKGRMVMNALNDEVAITVEENNHQQPEDSQLSSFINNIIDNTPESENTVIQPTTISYAEQHTVDPSLPTKQPAQEIMPVHEAAKKLNIISESDESSEDESIVEHPFKKKRNLKSVDDNISDDQMIDVHSVSKDDDDYLSQGSENNISQQKGEDENADFSDYDMDNENNDDTVIGKGNENEDESDCDDENISEHELKARLHREINNMKVFELDLDADRALSNIDLLEYIELLKVPKFRGVYMRDELPKRINPVECGIVNLSPHEQLGTHWICYAKVHKNRIYFDSFGRKTPLEIKMYMKTAEEFRNNTPVIDTSTDIVQRVDSSNCGHLCLFVLTSLMRERLSFQQVMDQLNYAFSKYLYW